MLYRYKCTDMGLACSYELKGNTLEEVTHKALEHIQEKHTADFNGVHSPAEITQMEQALSRSIRVVVS